MKLQRVQESAIPTRPMNAEQLLRAFSIRARTRESPSGMSRVSALGPLPRLSDEVPVIASDFTPVALSTAVLFTSR
jgi:hypothetical protein